jgi:hypothetical protein
MEFLVLGILLELRFMLEDEKKQRILMDMRE